MCAFQANGQGFYYIHDYSASNQANDEIAKAVITIVEGEITSKDLEDEFEVYIGQGWCCSAHLMAPKQ